MNSHHIIGTSLILNISNIMTIINIVIVSLLALFTVLLIFDYFEYQGYLRKKIFNKILINEEDTNHFRNYDKNYH